MVEVMKVKMIVILLIIILICSGGLLLYQSSSKGQIYEKVSAIEYKNSLYLFVTTSDWTSSGRTDGKIGVKNYDGHNWNDYTLLSEDVDIYTHPQVIVYNDLLIASWTSDSTGNVIRTYNGNNWTDPIYMDLNRNVDLNDVYKAKLTVFNNTLYYLWTEQDQNNIFYKTFNGNDWSDKITTPWEGLFSFGTNQYDKYLKTPPDIQIIEDKLYIVCFVGTYDPYDIISVRTYDGINWSEPIVKNITDEKFNRLTYEFCAFQGQLYFSWVTSNDYIFVTSFDGTQWTQDRNITESSTAFMNPDNGNPNLITYGTNLFVVWSVSNGDYMEDSGLPDPSYLFVKFYDGNKWSPVSNVSEGTSPNIITYEGKLYLFTRNGNTTTYDGHDWHPIQSHNQEYLRKFIMCLYNNNLVMIYEVGDTWSMTTYDGHNWVTSEIPLKV